ncbi:MAG: O-sialoglycoprotein endopeptidase [Bacillota bacterium]
MSKDLILGIDTSNYTTSVALLNQSGELIAQQRKKLKVEKGQRGLRQSKAVFQHLNQLPGIINNVIADHQKELAKIVVSTKPRDDEDSYMPVFRVGQAQAKTLAHALDIPLFEVSHQAGHLMAGLWSNDVRLDRFLALHLSGGTTELLLVETAGADFAIQEVGGSQDLTAGQFVDRVGVKLGLPFPAGADLEKLAQQSKGAGLELPYSVQDLEISFSGPCTAAMRKIEAGAAPEKVAAGVQQVIAHSLIELLTTAIEEYDCYNLLLVGGVMANQYLRTELKENLANEELGAKVYFADPQWSSDNAVGTSALGVKL